MLKQFFLLSTVLFGLSPTLSAQPGCRDPQALNYNSLATSNDGSCLYPVTNYMPALKANLPGELKEISGLEYAGGRWWGHTDSGTSPDLFNLNPENGDVLQKVTLQNAQSYDWEDITSNGTDLYIGDVGNNTNDRTNLGIYKTPLSKIGSNSVEIVSNQDWSFIPYTYADQTNFSTQPQDSTEFDCEAILVWQNKLHLFTKNWKTNQTVHYRINEVDSTAERLEMLNTDGIITAADVSPDGKLIALLGYDLRPFLPKVFVWLLWDWPPGSDDLVFTGNKRRIELGTALVVGQAESLAFASNRTGYIANERTDFNGVTLVKEQTRWFDFNAWVPELTRTTEATGTEHTIHSFPNPFRSSLQFQFPENEEPNMLRVFNALGQPILQLHGIVPGSLDTSLWQNGWYIFEAVWANGKTQTWRSERGDW